MSATYTFNVRHGGEIISIPMKTSTELPAFAMRHDGQNWYNKLVSPNDPLATRIRLRYSGADWALSLEQDNEDPAAEESETVTYTYTNHEQIVTGPNENDRARDWQWRKGTEGYCAIAFPFDFVYETDTHEEILYNALSPKTAHFHVAQPKLIGLATGEELAGKLEFSAYYTNGRGECYLDEGWNVADADGYNNGTCWKPQLSLDYDKGNPGVNDDEYKCGIYNKNNWVEGVDERGTYYIENYDENVLGRVKILYTVEEAHHTRTTPVTYHEYLCTDNTGDGHQLIETGGEQDWLDPEYNPGTAYRLDTGNVIIQLEWQDAFNAQNNLTDTPVNRIIVGNSTLAEGTDYTWTQGLFNRPSDAPYIDDSNYPNMGFLTLTQAGAAKVTDRLIITWSSFHAVDYNAQYSNN